MYLLKRHSVMDDNYIINITKVHVHVHCTTVLFTCTCICTCPLSDRSISSQRKLSGKEKGSCLICSLSGSIGPASITFSSVQWKGQNTCNYYTCTTGHTWKLYIHLYVWKYIAHSKWLMERIANGIQTHTQCSTIRYSHVMEFLITFDA